MGLPSSKFGQEIEQEEPTQGSLPSTPILTPKTKLVDLDPRSPSENIVRTPIEIFLAKTKKSLATDGTKSLPLENSSSASKIYTPTVKLKNIDPRSPTVDFERTPIVVPEDEATLPLKFHNKNLDNVCRTLMNSPLTISGKKPPSITTPKLLESNIINPKLYEQKRKSYMGLLETNLDFVETDLDKVNQDFKMNKSTEDRYSRTSNSYENSETGNEPVLETEIVEEFLIHNKNNKISCQPSTDSTEDICSNGPQSFSTEGFEGLVPVLETLDIKDTSKEIQFSKIFNNYHEDDDGLKITSYTTVEEKVKFNIDKKQITQSNKDFLKDFDKKLSNLIYEDKEKSQTVIRNRKFYQYRSRMPLGTRNSNANPKKNISKLKVHDKPQKNIKDFSKIPVLQNKKGKFQQCENTPPRSIDDNKKMGKHQWDADNTLII